MATAETIAKALGGRKAGGGWTARCPAHDDRTPSLSIRDADDGKVLVRCHAGCDQERVIAALRGARPVGRERSALAVAHAAPHTCRAQAGSRRRQAQRGRARHLAIRQAGTGNAGRDLSRLARPRPAATRRAPLPCRPEASLGRHLAGDGGAGDARRGRNAARDPSHLPCPRRRRQGAGRSAEDDARPMPRRCGAPRRARRRADGRRRHRDLPRRHAGDRTPGLGGAFDLRACAPSICRTTCAT